MEAWKLDDIEWQKFRPDLVDPKMLAVLKATSVIEQNIRVPETYLRNVFADDRHLLEVVDVWSTGERLHGQALAKWVQLCEPDFDFDACFNKFMQKFSIPLDSAQSVRGSKCGELVSRCVVEAATSSFYSALRDSTQEPVLRELLSRIARDEIHHYKIFLRHLSYCAATERTGLLRRITVAVGRILESEDDEVAYAFHVTNSEHRAYNRKASINQCKSIGYSFYRPCHMRQCITLIFNAIGLPAHGKLSKLCTHIAFVNIRRRSKRDFSN